MAHVCRRALRSKALQGGPQQPWIGSFSNQSEEGCAALLLAKADKTLRNQRHLFSCAYLFVFLSPTNRCNLGGSSHLDSRASFPAFRYLPTTSSTPVTHLISSTRHPASFLPLTACVLIIPAPHHSSTRKVASVPSISQPLFSSPPTLPEHQLRRSSVLFLVPSYLLHPGPLICSLRVKSRSVARSPA
jgi:hypothetical protein